MDRDAYKQKIENFHYEYLDGTNNQSYNRAYEDLIEALERNSSQNDLQDALDNYFRKTSELGEDIGGRLGDSIDDEIRMLKTSSYELGDAEQAINTAQEADQDLDLATRNIYNEIEAPTDQTEDQLREIQSLLKTDDRTNLENEQLQATVQDFANQAAALIEDPQVIEQLQTTMEANNLDFVNPTLNNEQTPELEVELATEAKEVEMEIAAPTESDLAMLQEISQTPEPELKTFEPAKITPLGLPEEAPMPDLTTAIDSTPAIDSAPTPDTIEQTHPYIVGNTRWTGSDWQPANDSERAPIEIASNTEPALDGSNNDLTHLELLANAPESHPYLVGNTYWAGPQNGQEPPPVTDLEQLDSILADLKSERQEYERNQQPPTVDEHFDNWSKESEQKRERDDLSL